MTSFATINWLIRIIKKITLVRVIFYFLLHQFEGVS